MKLLVLSGEGSFLSYLKDMQLHGHFSTLLLQVLICVCTFRVVAKFSTSVIIPDGRGTVFQFTVYSVLLTHSSEPDLSPISRLLWPGLSPSTRQCKHQERYVCEYLCACTYVDLKLFQSLMHSLYMCICIHILLCCIMSNSAVIRKY